MWKCCPILKEIVEWLATRKKNVIWEFSSSYVLLFCTRWTMCEHNIHWKKDLNSTRVKWYSILSYQEIITQLVSFAGPASGSQIPPPPRALYVSMAAPPHDSLTSCHPAAIASSIPPASGSRPFVWKLSHQQLIKFGSGVEWSVLLCRDKVLFPVNSWPIHWCFCTEVHNEGHSLNWSSAVHFHQQGLMITNLTFVSLERFNFRRYCA